MLTALKKNEKGLTLIELLAVLVIIGIIAAIAIPAITGTINNAKARADEATNQIIEEAALRYALDKSTNMSATFNGYRTAGTTINVHVIASAGTGATGSPYSGTGLFVEGYLNELPTWNNTSLRRLGVSIIVGTSGGFTVTTLADAPTAAAPGP